MFCIQGIYVSCYPLVNFTDLEVLATIIYCHVNIEAVHLDAIALVKRVSDNGALVLVFI
jgi:hypothetical protein